jgi:hypothetical protein
MATPETRDAKLDLSTKHAARRVERQLDDAVEDSFPASDPVSFAMPRNRVEPGLISSATDSTATWFLLGGGLLALIAFFALRR